MKYIPIIGSAALLLLIAIFAYMYWAAIPTSSDVATKPVVRLPKIDSADLEAQLRELKKVEGLPIQIDPAQLGKENPYF